MKIKDIHQKLAHKIIEPLPGDALHQKFAPFGRSLKYDPESGLSLPKKGAVMLLISPDESGNPSILFTLRKANLKNHGGQISFPGGRFNEDEVDAVDVAIRECFEETGINIAKNQIMGNLTPLYIMPSNFDVQPVVALIDHKPEHKIQVEEVEEVFFITLFDLINAELNTVNIELKEGLTLQSPAFIHQERVIWGATAMILNEMLALLKS